VHWRRLKRDEREHVAMVVDGDIGKEPSGSSREREEDD
jgi:hypothetical protein